METSWENHGYVTISDETGKTLAHSDDIQHNRCNNRSEQIALILQQVNDVLSESLKGEDTTDEEVESESSSLKA